ncbi:MAG: universal stress protein [Ferruginibacter sp.]
MIEFNIRRILVPVDFNPASINALDTAIAMAKKHDAAILLLNVVESGGLTAVDNVSREELNSIVQYSEQELQSLQDSIIERFLVSCEALTTIGTVISSIIKVSVDYQADIIVMGTHGASSFKDIFVGSNAYNVVKSSVCPVLTIPPEKKCELFKKILFPVRPIPHALEKYDFVRKIIGKDDATIKVLGLATDYEKEVELLKDLASQLNERLKDDEMDASTYFKVGNNMAEEVLKIAALMAADLIVITATTDSSSRQFFVGHYTQYIINHAHFPVLSIRPPGESLQHEEAVLHHQESYTPEMQFYN